MYTWTEMHDDYDYYLDILDMVPNERISIELDEDGIMLDDEQE